MLQLLCPSIQLVQFRMQLSLLLLQLQDFSSATMSVTIVGWTSLVTWESDGRRVDNQKRRQFAYQPSLNRSKSTYAHSFIKFDDIDVNGWIAWFPWFSICLFVLFRHRMYCIKTHPLLSPRDDIIRSVIFSCIVKLKVSTIYFPFSSCSIDGVLIIRASTAFLDQYLI